MRINIMQRNSLSFYHLSDTTIYYILASFFDAKTLSNFAGSSTKFASFVNQRIENQEQKYWMIGTPIIIENVTAKVTYEKKITPNEIAQSFPKTGNVTLLKSQSAAYNLAKSSRKPRQELQDFMMQYSGPVSIPAVFLVHLTGNLKPQNITTADASNLIPIKALLNNSIFTSIEVLNVRKTLSENKKRFKARWCSIL